MDKGGNIEAGARRLALGPEDRGAGPEGAKTHQRTQVGTVKTFRHGYVQTQSRVSRRRSFDWDTKSGIRRQDFR